MSGDKILALSGGVGGAKLSWGLDQIAAKDTLTIIANTGDDFIHLGLYISPDSDTLIYTLAGVNDPKKGWGRAYETWKTHSALGVLGIENWFQIGDKDLALHFLRNELREKGLRLTEITQSIAQQFGLKSRILPMSDDPVLTIIESDIGCLPFQEYFVKHQSKPSIRKISFEGSAKATISPELKSTIENNEFAAIIFCPSNPYLSIDPILSIKEIKSYIQSSAAPVIAVSPIVAGKALRGPAAKIMNEMGIPVSVTSVAQHYQPLIDGLIIDERDKTMASEIQSMGIEVEVTNTIMKTDADKVQLAQDLIAFSQKFNTKKGLI